MEGENFTFTRNKLAYCQQFHFYVVIEFGDKDLIVEPVAVEVESADVNDDSRMVCYNADVDLTATDEVKLLSDDHVSAQDSLVVDTDESHCDTHVDGIDTTLTNVSTTHEFNE